MLGVQFSPKGGLKYIVDFWGIPEIVNKSLWPIPRQLNEYEIVSLMLFVINYGDFPNCVGWWIVNNSGLIY